MVSEENDAIVLCGSVSPKRKPPDVRKVLELSTFGRDRNVNIKISDISERLAARVPDVWADLLDIAVYVYSADQLVTRGGSGVAGLGDKWPRHFYFHIPVRDKNFWSSPEVLDELRETLSFLSDDDYTFEFFAHQDLPRLTEYLEFAQGGKTYHEADTVMLFSGGLDSLAGAIQEIVVERKKTVLVNHRTTGKVAGPTCDLVTLLRQKHPHNEPIFIPVWANKSEPANDFNQRTRSFVYASLAATVAAIFGHTKIKFYENGVTSINLPIAEQVTGTRATRSTHPKVITNYEKLLSLVAKADFKVETPFLWKTKSEVVSIIGERGCQDLISRSRSCSRTIRSTREKSHCGLCSQCIDRRFAILAAGLSDFDPADKYEVDLLIGAREEGPERTMAESIVRFARELRDLSDDGIFIKFPQLNHILQHTGIVTDKAAENVIGLFRRHAEQVCRVMDENLAKYASQFNEGLLPDSCLIVLAMPEKYKVSTAPCKTAELIKARHSKDFRSVTVNGRTYTFTSRQAQIVQILWEHWEGGTPEVGQDYILEELGTSHSRLRDSFRRCPAWGRLIIPGSRKGTFRLNI